MSSSNNQVTTKKSIKVKGKAKAKAEEAKPIKEEPMAGGADDAGADAKPEPVVEPPAPPVVQPMTMPVTTQFEAEIALLPKGFDPKDSLGACKADVASAGIKVAEWRVKQYRLYLSGVDEGLLDEVKASHAGQGLMSRKALTFYDMLVTLADKDKKKGRNGRVPMAMNARLNARAFHILAEAVDVVPQALVYAQECYTYECYEVANAMCLNPTVTDADIQEYMTTKFCHGWFSSESAKAHYEAGTELYGARKVRAKKPLTLDKATDKIMDHVEQDPEALAALIAKLQAVQARQTPSPTAE